MSARVVQNSGRKGTEDGSLAEDLVYQNTILGTRYIETRGYHAYARRPKQISLTKTECQNKSMPRIPPLQPIDGRYHDDGFSGASARSGS